MWVIYFFLSGVRFTVHRVLCRESWREVRHRRCPFFRKTFGGASLTNADSEVSIAEWQVQCHHDSPWSACIGLGTTKGSSVVSGLNSQYGRILDNTSV